MKNLLNLGIASILLLSSCGLAMSDQGMIDITLPKTYSPPKLVGGWASGYTRFNQVVDAYDGRHEGNTWQSGRYFKITDDGRNSEFYFMMKSPSSSSAIKAAGTIRFDVGSTEQSGAFSFLALKAHYKGWGSVSVDRDATESELKNSLSGKYFYQMIDGRMRIEPSDELGPNASSFKKIEQ
ncbi:hypothetical protein EON65_02225 [archaeon]|nr:MAG: hypothetical protein EON65_02225 [archaeon]